jgi:hypothetical protein
MATRQESWKGRQKMRAAILGFERRARGLRGRARPPAVRLTFDSPSAHLVLTRAQGVLVKAAAEGVSGK